MPDFKKVFSRFKVNRYFIVLLLVCFLMGYLKEILVLFLCVLMHELCHVLTAKIYKLKIRNIEVFPFGGVARIENLDYAGTLKEIVITIAGPLSNLVAAMLLFFLRIRGIAVPMHDYLIQINISLALFNLLPGMPLDGGRIFRAVMSYFIGFKKSSRAAAMSGKIIAGVMLIFGVILLFNGRVDIGLLTMPFFLFLSAKKEENASMFTIINDAINKKKRLKSLGVMETRDICVHENKSICDILKYFDFDRYHIIYVINEEMKVEYIMTESQLFDNLPAGTDDVTIRDVCIRIREGRAGR